MKKGLALLLLVGMFCCLVACGEVTETTALCERWTTDKAIEADTVIDKLEKLGFDEKEIALMDTKSLTVVQTLEFSGDGSYVFAYDKTLSQLNARTFINGMFEVLYENRAKLTDLYGNEIVDCQSADEFESVYATVFGYESYENLLDGFTDFFMDPAVLDSPIEKGTFTLKDSRLYLTENTSDETLSVGVTLHGDVLKLQYKDKVTVSYKKS